MFYIIYFHLGIRNPYGFAIDWISNNLYVSGYTDRAGFITVSKLDGAYRTILNISPQVLRQPNSLAVDPVKGYFNILPILFVQFIFVGRPLGEAYQSANAIAKMCVRRSLRSFVRYSVTRVIPGRTREPMEFIFGRYLHLDNSNPNLKGTLFPTRGEL